MLTLSQLIQSLLKNPQSEYKSIFEQFKVDKRELSNYENWSFDKYMRNGIYKNNQFELILLCWEKGQETSIHCHDGEECWIFLLEGEMEEVKYKKGEKDNLIITETRKISEQQRSYINDTVGLHKLKNSYDGRSMSLHLYARPILKCSYFDDSTQTFITKTLKYDTFDGKICNPIETVV